MNKIISYYDLLGMIKEGNIPEKVEYKYITYNWDGSTYKKGDSAIYLSDINETDMFNKNIEILNDDNDDFEDIEEIELGRISPNGECIISVNDEKIQDKINELIKAVNKLKNENK